MQPSFLFSSLKFFNKPIFDKLKFRRFNSKLKTFQQNLTKICISWKNSACKLK
jgi:hypothetical protein